MPDFLDINHLRARGLQPGEEELPDIAPPIIIPDDPKGTYWLLLSWFPFPSSTYWFSLSFTFWSYGQKKQLCASVIEDCFFYAKVQKQEY